MRERIALVNGTFELQSRPGEGTCVVASVALTDEDEA
jgi:signal transduction histidine kinase